MFWALGSWLEEQYSYVRAKSVEQVIWVCSFEGQGCDRVTSLWSSGILSQWMSVFRDQHCRKRSFVSQAEQKALRVNGTGGLRCIFGVLGFEVIVWAVGWGRRM